MCIQNKVQSKSRDHTERKSGLQKNSRWSPFRSVLCVGSLKRPKHAVHDEGNSPDDHADLNLSYII